MAELAEDLADYFSEFDLIVSYLYDPDGIFRTNVGRCTGAQFIAGPHRPDEQAGLHATKVYLKPLERLAIFDADHVPRLTISPHPTILSYLALHPGSGSERKNWPEAKWAELLRRLIDSTELDLLLVGGEAEGERLQRLNAALVPTRVRVAQSRPLPELARELECCAAFVGPRFGDFPSRSRGWVAGSGSVGGHGGRDLAAAERKDGGAAASGRAGGVGGG